MSATVKPPVWYWIIAVFAILWNGFGLFDFYKSITLNEEYLSAYPGYLDFIKAMPMWAKIAWGTAVGSAVLASLSLLIKKAFAYPLFILGVLAMFVSFGYQFTTSNKPESNGFMMVMTAVIFLLAFFFVWFAKKSKANGWIG